MGELGIGTAVKHTVSMGCQSQGSARVNLARTRWGCEEILVPRGLREVRGEKGERRLSRRRDN